MCGSVWLSFRKQIEGLAICPATSPENLFYEDCSVAEYSENTLAIARNLFQDYVKGCEVLGLQNQIMCDVLEALERMVPTAVGSKGQILEWNQEFPEQDVHHRHVSHLYELHPGCGITPQTPELYKAVRKSLELRGGRGNRMESGLEGSDVGPYGRWRSCGENYEKPVLCSRSNGRNGNTKRWHLSQFILCPPTVPD